MKNQVHDSARVTIEIMWAATSRSMLARRAAPRTTTTAAPRRPRQRCFHCATPQRAPNNGNEKGGHGTTNIDAPPVQTLNKSPIVQKLWRTRDEAIQSCRNARPEWEWTCEHGDLQDPECGEGRFFDYAKGECQAIC